MNLSTAIFLINKDARAISVSYDLAADGKTPTQLYTYKTMDHSIKKGDHVVIPTDTRHKMTVVRVEAVDVDVDLEGGVQIKWIIDKVEIAEHARIQEAEAQAIKAIQSAEKRRKREELAKSLMADNPDLMGLDVVNMAPALQPPPAPTPHRHES